MVVAVVLALVLGGGSDDAGPADAAADLGDAPKEIFLEPIASAGSDPFTASVDTGTAPTTTAAPTTTTAPPTTVTPATEPAAGVRAVTGSRPGLYGGTMNDATCDAEQLVAFLESDPGKAAAWASVHGIDPAGIRAYVSELTPVLLQRDTRVTNHGFRSGRPTPRHAVLQAGSAVLVDRYGLPRVRCYCGNPLLPAVPTVQTFVGEPWPTFDPAAVEVVTEGEPVDSFVLTDVDTGGTITRPVGSAGAADVPGPPLDAIATTTTTGPSAPVDDGNIAPQGTAVAESTYGADRYPADLAIDGDRSTSWFSAGPGADGDLSTFVWTAPSPTAISGIGIHGNGENAEEANRVGFGFEQVQVQVTDADGNVVFDQTASLAGSPDPFVHLDVAAVASQVALIFSGHEADDCGGFAELVLTPG